MASIPMISEQEFEREVLESGIPVVVDFSASWCGPCRMLDPLLEKAAEKYRGKVKFVKMNSDESSDLFMRYGVRSIPTLIGFKGGERKRTSVGFIPEGKLEQFIDDFLLS